jgi:hypothetical protein
MQSVPRDRQLAEGGNIGPKGGMSGGENDIRSLDPGRHVDMALLRSSMLSFPL